MSDPYDYGMRNSTYGNQKKRDPCMSNRPKIEEILMFPCIRCCQPAGSWCKRDPAEFRSWAKQALCADGTPPHHVERLWLAQGKTVVEIMDLRSAQKADT